MDHSQANGLGTGTLQQGDERVEVETIKPRAVHANDLVPGSEACTRGGRTFRRLKHHHLSRLNVEDGAESQSLSARLLLQQLKLVSVKEGRERIEHREHAANGPIHDGLIRV